MKDSIYDEDNEKYLRKFIESDDEQKTQEHADETLTRVITKPEAADKPDIRRIHGGKPIPPSALTSKGIFYPKDLVIVAFPLSVKTIRHFSSIDEQDGLQVDERLAMVLNEAVKVQSKLDPAFSVDSILEIDRIFLLIVVRNLTFIEFPTILTVKCKCTECGEEDAVDVKAERIGSLKRDSISEYLSKYSEDGRCIRASIGKEQVDLWLPSCHNLSVARNHLSGASSQDKFMLCFLVPPSVKLTEFDFDAFDSAIDSWTPAKYVYVKSFVQRVNSSYSVDIYYQCSSCGAGVAAPLRFRGGVRELFVPEFSS